MALRLKSTFNLCLKQGRSDIHNSRQTDMPRSSKKAMGVGSSKKALSKDQVEDDMHEDEYEVEKIVDHRGKGKTFEYRIRWQGYAEDEDTWEPPGNINNAGLKVHDYWEKRLAQQETVAARGSKAPEAVAAPKAVGGVKKKASSTPKRGTSKRGSS